MNPEAKGLLQKEPPCLPLNDNKRPPGSFLDIHFYEKKEAKMGAKFHAGNLKNGGSTERNGGVKGMEGVND